MPRSCGRLLALMVVGGCVNLDLPPQLRDAGSGTGADTHHGDAGRADAPLDMLAGGSGGAPDGAADPDGSDGPAPSDGDPGDAIGSDGPRLALGRSCQQATQCESSSCVDGVCCASACDGSCHRCDLAGFEGACRPVPPGEDPDEECAQEGLANCGRDGTCNGAGACRRYAEGTECAPGGCTGSVEQAASTCDAAGVCVPGQTRSCDPNACMGGSCASACGSSADCQAGFFCQSGACRIKRAIGASCGAAAECASGYCADGVCCGTPCTESCHSCNASGFAGTCRPVAMGEDPRNTCPSEPVASCGRAGGCDGSGGCRLHPGGTPCAPAACTNAVESAVATCSGLGSCVPGVVRGCGAYVCSGAACASTCSGATGCTPGHACTGSTCSPLPAPLLYWRLDEASGTSALDASGNGFVGTYIGDVGIPAPSTFVPSLRFADPASRAFTGASRHAIRIAAAPAALEPTTALTMSLWFRVTALDSGGGGIAASELISFGDATILRLRAADIEVTKRTPGSFTRCFGPATGHLDGTWHHVAATIDPTRITTYLDGVVICELTTPAASLLYDRGSDLLVGRHGFGGTQYDFSGNLDEVRIYDRALSADEIRALAAGN